MRDLKPFYDAVIASAEEVQRVAQEIDGLFQDGTEDGKVKALALRPKLDEAQIKNDEAASMYESMQKADRPNDVAQNFVPVSSTTTEPGDGNQPTVIKRQTYDVLTLVDRAKFIRSGGKVED